MRWKQYLFAVGVVAGATVVGLAFRGRLLTVDVAMLYLLAVVVVATRSGRSAALLSSALGIATFDFFFVPPYHTFAVDDTRYLLTFVVMLVVALVMGGLTGRIREHAAEAVARERQAMALFALNRDLTTIDSREALLRAAGRHIAAALNGGGTATFLLVEPDSTPGPEWPGERDLESPSFRVAAGWAFDRGEAAGWGTTRCAEAEGVVLPFQLPGRKLGVVALRPARPDREPGAGELDTMQALADQTALAYERLLLSERHETARVVAEGERLRSSLLSTLSHDLRTPLGGIEGAASSLLADEGALPAEDRRDLALTIVEESHRMTRLIGNLLEMMRLETGELAVRKAWQPLEETVGVALLRLDDRLAGHPVEVNFPEDLPLVPIDELLLEQVFVNLLENAVKHTPAGTPIRITARAEDGGGTVLVEVSDRGPGISAGDEETVFRKFARGIGAPVRGAGGLGLGLTICRGIVAAHGGRIWVEPGRQGGAVFRFTLPLNGPPMPSPPAEAGVP